MPRIILLLLSAVVAFSQVTVSIAQPNAGQTIGQIYQAGGTATPTSGNYLTLIEMSVDGGSYASVGFSNGSHTLGTMGWVAAVQAASMSVGAHTLQFRATDSLGNTGAAPSPVSITVIHSNPVCSHSAVSGSSTVFCETMMDHIISGAGNSVSVTKVGGYTAGQLIFCQVEASVPASPRTQLAVGASIGATTITVNSSAGFPSTPFSVTLSPVNGIGTATPQIPNPEDVVTVTNISGVTWTTSPLPHAHVAGEVAGSWHTHDWQAGYLTNTLAYSWTFWGNLGTRATDNDIEQEAVFFTFVPATTAATDTITAHNPDGDGNVAVINCGIYTGAISVGNSTSLMGWGGPSDGSTATPGNAYINPLSVSVGDLVISAVFSAPVDAISPDTLRVQDGSRPFSMIADRIASVTSASPQFLMNVDGFSEIVLAFHTGSASAAGRSIVLSSQTVSNGSITAQPTNAACTVEISMHSWGTPTTGDHPAQPLACDLNLYWVVGGASPVIGINSLHETGGTSNCLVGLAGKNLASLRYQRVPTSSTTGSDVCQFFDENGTEFARQSWPYTGISAGSSANGFILGGTTGSVSFAYARIYTTNFPLTATPPTTAQDQTGALFQWKFDLGNNTGSLLDSTANHFDAVISSGSPSYVDTLYQNLVVASLRTCNAPSWSLWITMKTGATNCLDGSSSYSQANGSPTVVPTWGFATVPSTPTFLSPSSLITNLTGVNSFGTYNFNILVTDTALRTASISLPVGAANFDANGVIIPSDPNVTKIFGQMIAFGYNPWGYEDERACTAMMIQSLGKDCLGNSVGTPNPYPTNSLTWTQLGTGTVAYPFAGKGASPGQSCTTLSAGINSSDTSLLVADASCLSVTSLPTWILVGNVIGSQEMIRVSESIGTGATCGTAASPVTTGPAKLCVSYDGRGMASNGYAALGTHAAQSWSMGVNVGEMRIQGTSTLFGTDANRPMCPAGLPGPMGLVVYSTGTVTLSPGSTTVTLSGGAWTGGNGVAVGNSIRVTATHASGTPFIFWAVITTLTDSTHAVMSRAAPTGVDGTAFSYKIVGQFYLSLQFKDTVYKDTASSFALDQMIQGGMGCESETAAFAVAGHDITSLDSTNQSGVGYSYKLLQSGFSSPFGSNFYGTDLAGFAQYYRSGYETWNTFGKSIANYYVRDPEVGSGWSGCSSPLYCGGAVLGAVANTMLNGSALTHMSDLRPWAQTGVNFFSTYHSSCANPNPYDTRDQSYLQDYVVWPAMFDTDPTFQPQWLTALGSAGGGAGILGRDTNTCAHSDFSFAVPMVVPAVISSQFPNRVVTLTNGSTDVQGTGFTTSMAAGVAAGTITVTTGLATATLVSGSLGSLATNYNITIVDTTSSPNYVGQFEFSFVGSAVKIAGLWPGMSGTFNFVVQDNRQGGGALTSIASANSDADAALQSESWVLTYVSSTHMTLNRPWDDAVTGGSIHPNGTYYMLDCGNFGVGPCGNYQQSFMHGKKTQAIAWAANFVPNSTIQVGNRALLGPTSNWFRTIGYDINTDGAYYSRGQQGLNGYACEPFVTANSTNLFVSIHGSGPITPCGYSGKGTSLGDGTGEFTERVNSQEAFSDVIEYYNAQCLLGISQCNAARAFGDRAYGAIWGNCSMTSGGGSTYYCDPNYVNTANELSNASIGGSKWSGFFFGLGMAHQWPAVRLSGASGTPPAPLGVTATPGNTQISLSWASSTGAITYNVYRGASPGGEGVTPFATGISATLYLNTGLTNGVTYYYKVSGVNAFGEGALSSEVTGTPSGSPPPASGMGIGGSFAFGGQIGVQ